MWKSTQSSLEHDNYYFINEQIDFPKNIDAFLDGLICVDSRSSFKITVF